MADENQPGDGNTVKAISKEKLQSLVRRVGNLRSEAATATGKVGEMVADHVEKHNLHRKAFSIASQMVKMGKDNPAKLQEFLFNLDLYREHLEIDKMMPDDMLEDRKGKRGAGKKGTEAKGANGEAPRARLRAIPGGGEEATQQ